MKNSDPNYRSYIGPEASYDLMSANQFGLLTGLGLRRDHKILDIGCGSLRVGKLLLPYLNPSCYFGVEPNKWLIDAGINNELGKEILKIKSPRFSDTGSFELGTFNETFNFIIAQSVFSHASKEQIIKCIKESRNVLKTNGIFVANFSLGFEDYNGKEWVYPKCVKYTEQTIGKIIKSNDLGFFKSEYNHPNRLTWYIIFHPDYIKNARRLHKSLFKNQKTTYSRRLKNLIKKNPIMSIAPIKYLLHKLR